MSQEKVDRYKKQKANRKKIMRRQKIKGVMWKTMFSLVVLAVVAWMGYSAYDIYESGIERVVAEVNYDAVTDYLNNLSTEEEDSDDSEESGESDETDETEDSDESEE